MKHLTRISLTAFAVIALIAAPVSAQSRGGRGGGGSRGSGGSHSSGMSHGGGSRSGGYSGGSSRSYGGGGYSRSSGSSSRSYSYSSGSSSRSYGSPQQRGGSSSSRSSGSYSRQSSPRSGGSISRSSGTTPRSSGSVSRSSATSPRTNGAVSRSVNGGAPRTRGISAEQAARSVAAGNVRANSRAARGNAVSPREVHMNGNNPNVRRIPPRERRPIPYDRPDRFWHGHHHYFGHRIDFLPPGYVIHHYWGRPYYFYDGFWYRPYLGSYFICRPPFGFVYVPDIIDVAFAACRIAFYCAELNTYRTVDENAQTIADQNAIIAQNNATIAQQNADIAFNAERARESYEQANGLGLVQAYADASTEYFYDDGVFFTKSDDGKYTVIVPPAGALVNELPDDFDKITLDGKEYYKVDDTIYELKVVDGTAYFQVLGQMTGELAEKYDFNNK